MNFFLMNSVVIASISFGCAIVGLGLGFFLRRCLPNHHLNPESQEVVKLATGLIGTMAALVLGLLIASASAGFDTEGKNLQELGADLFLLDRDLIRFGPETAEARKLLRATVAALVTRLEQQSTSRELDSGDYSRAANAIAGRIRDLSPKTEAQQTIQNQALEVISDISRARWNLIQGRDNPIPLPFLVVLLTWIFVLFACFGLLSPGNTTVVAVLIASALTVAGGMLLIVELGDPFDGLLQVSNQPLRDALRLLDT